MSGRSRILPWLALFTIYVVWGSTYLAIRVAVTEMPPFAAACLRFVVAGAAMAGIAAFVDRGKGFPSRRQLLDYSLIGVLFLGTGNGLVMWSEQRIPSGIAAMIPVVQKELGLKDEESAKKLFYSNTFDFTSMGAVLVKKLLKELQSSIGFYEVQTGQSIGSVLCTQLPTSLTWLGTTMAGSLGVPQLKAELLPWLESQNIKLSDGVTLGQPEERWFGLFSLLASYQNAVPDEKK